MESLAIIWSTSSTGQASRPPSTRPKITLSFLSLLRQGKEILCQHSDHTNQVHLGGEGRTSLPLIRDDCRGRRSSWSVSWSLLYDYLGWNDMDEGKLWIFPGFVCQIEL